MHGDFNSKGFGSNNLTSLEQQIINSLYPDPSKMSYEEMLKLEEDMGKVNKGFKHEDLKVKKRYKFSFLNHMTSLKWKLKFLMKGNNNILKL